MVKDGADCWHLVVGNESGQAQSRIQMGRFQADRVQGRRFLLQIFAKGLGFFWCRDPMVLVWGCPRAAPDCCSRHSSFMEDVRKI